MRLLSKRQLKELVLYSPQHIARLEKAGQFPRRVRLGQCRVGWVEEEVIDWLRKRIARRDET
jgi:prophage regulatory protein